MPADELVRRGDLGGAALGTLAPLIVDAFSEADLTYLLRVKMSYDLARLIDVAAAYDTVVFDLFLALQRRGIVVDFLRHALDARPARLDLRQAVQIHCPEALQAAPDAAITANNAAAGLGAVKQALVDPNVRNLIAPHRDELARLMDDIEILANYKRLHDALQTIQFIHQQQMTADMLRLRSDEIAGTTLENHAFQLDELCRNATKAAEGLPDTAAVRRAELRWVNKLKLLVERIRKAIDTLDDQDGAQAMRSLRLLVRPEPARINTLLTLTAQQLPLERLISTVADVVRVTSTAGNSSARIIEGLQSLQRMLPQLKGRVAEHEQWQEIEKEFLDTDDFVDQGTPSSIDIFRDVWETAKQSVAALAGTEPGAAWAQKSQKLTLSIDAALVGETDKARSEFAKFRHTVLFHFFQVDRALRYECEAVLAIKAPLQSLLNEV